ncbi:zf-HC2 domain-containing protein [Alloalcanivorax sp. C16-2]|uniref:zf-HC2 domain-containing protein n=1 Tax=Alloalcanivorax TaxID=3020832 RepID=UPI001931B10A|nr:zf-HC2 domain-containing protein [Alloalcanivorax marinus]MBL7250563.1 zf-HC2 domain-containing protein [Alloalcanivorax marinus]
MLKCRDLVNQADLLIDGAELRTGRRMALRTHLLICRHCRRYLRQLDALTHHLHQPPPPLNERDTRAVLERLEPRR